MSAVSSTVSSASHNGRLIVDAQYGFAEEVVRIVLKGVLRLHQENKLGKENILAEGDAHEKA